jgi:hypothetical protein
MATRGEPTVTLTPRGEWWHATWSLPVPAQALRFERLASGFRSRTFEVLTPGYAFAREGEEEVLRTSGLPSRTIEVRFKPFTDHLPKDYQFFQKFSDGSVAIYTGHLLAHTDAMVRRFRFVPAPGSSVVVADRRHPSAAAWTDADGQGTYVYFGSIVPVETKDTISIVDPGLPDWLESASRQALPQLFAIYTERLGAKLPDRPAVLFNWVESDHSGFGRSGGTLPGLIQLEIQGAAWKTPSADGLHQIFHFLAHEAAHLWNGQIIHSPNDEDAWMHEGSADALAERVLLAMGMIDERTFLDDQTAALNQCRRGLGTAPLRTAAARRKFELYYACGNAIALVTETSVDGDLLAFWRSLIARVLAGGDNLYDAEDYIGVWRERGADDGDVAGLRALLDTPAQPDVLLDLLKERGVTVSVVDDPPQEYGQTLAREALLHLLTGRCRGSYGFNSTLRGLVLNTPLNCEGFAAGEAVTAIGGHDVLRDGHRVWDHLYERCASSGTVVVTAGGRSVPVPCTKPVPARPDYLRIESRPEEARSPR